MIFTYKYDNISLMIVYNHRPNIMDWGTNIEKDFYSIFINVVYHKLYMLWFNSLFQGCIRGYI